MNPGSFFSVILLACMWGPSFLFIKVGVQEIPPLTLTLARVFFAALLLVLLLRLRGLALPGFGMIWVHLTVMAVLSCIVPFSLINYAEVTIDSSLVGIINGLVPLLATLLAHIFIVEEHLTWKRTGGVLLGLLGFLLLMLPSLQKHGVDVNTQGILMVGLASLSYAIGMVYGRRYLSGLTTLALPTMQLLLATAIILPIALWWEQPWTLPIPSTSALLAVAMLSLWGTAAAFVVFFYILGNFGVVALAVSVYLLPPFSIFFGVIFLGEVLSGLVFVATALILCGMVLVSQTAISRRIE
ncbi:MAG: DMT family transporter [Gammaproteobacteria bacterium]